MRLFTEKLLMDEKSESEGSGGITGFVAQSEVPNETVTSTNPPPTQTEGDNFDEFGYPKTDAGTAKPPGEGDKKPEPPKTPEPPKDPATGYGDEPPPKVKEEAAPVVKEPDVALGYEVKTDGLPEAEVTDLKKFFKDNEVGAKAAQAIADHRKEFFAASAKAQADAVKAQEREIAKTKSAWHTELKEDPTFGKDNFAKNVQSVEKLVEEYMPNTKKILTERKSMLPPYVMRDLLKLSESLFATERYTQGEPQKPKEEPEEDDGTGFYK